MFVTNTQFLRKRNLKIIFFSLNYFSEHSLDFIFFIYCILEIQKFLPSTLSLCLLKTNLNRAEAGFMNSARYCFQLRA